MAMSPTYAPDGNATDNVTIPPLMFGKPLLNNVMRFDHVQLQKRSGCRVYWVLCQNVPLAKLCR